MITQVNALGSGVIKDPRRKAQSVQFKRGADIPYKSGYNEQFTRQKNNALWTSFSIVAGSILFTIGYFMLAALNTGAKSAKQVVRHA